MPRRVLVALLALTAAAGGGCTWVQVTDAGEAVRVGTAEQVSDCERVGRVSAVTRQRVLGIPRSGAKVRRELFALARNEAGTLGGDVIVPIDELEDGRRSFSVWRCGGR